MFTLNSSKNITIFAEIKNISWRQESRITNHTHIVDMHFRASCNARSIADYSGKMDYNHIRDYIHTIQLGNNK